MKKIAVVAVLILICVMCFSSCGNNEKEIRENLRGSWGYSFSAIKGNGYCTLEFTEKTVEYNLWYSDVPNSYTYKGKYEITDDEIIITYYDNDEKDKIDYSYNNGELKLYYRGSDGSWNEKLVRID